MSNGGDIAHIIIGVGKVLPALCNALDQVLSSPSVAIPFNTVIFLPIFSDN